MYVREVDDKVLTLRVSGKLWMRSLVMSDSETNTEWAHLLGRGMKGELAGKELKPLVSDMVTWETWKSAHPKTTVLDMSKTSRNYTSEFYRTPSRFVVGFVVKGNPYSISMADLLNKPVHQFEVEGVAFLSLFDRKGMVVRLFHRDLAEQTLAFASRVQPVVTDTTTKSKWTLTGQAVAGELKGNQLQQAVSIMSFQKAWDDFHPKSTPIKF